MEAVTKILMTFVQDRQSAEMMTLLLIAAAVFCIIFGLLLLINSYLDPVRQRFIEDKRYIPDNAEDLTSDNSFYSKFSRYVMPSDDETSNRTILRLHHAGYHFRRYLYQYYAIRMLLMIILPLATFIVLPFLPSVKLDNYFFILMIAWLVGFIAPSFILDYMISKRQKVIERAFPDALDLLVVCTEAGLSLNAAIQKVAGEIGFSHPILGRELNLLIAEVRAGVDRKKAFTGLAQRTGVEEIRGLMSSLNQSIRFGSNIASTLRIYSEEFRDRRMQAIEEQAATIGVKLIFPTAFCLLPCCLLLIVIPFGLNLKQVFSNL